MRTSRVGFVVVIASLVACQNAGAPANLSAGGPAFSEHGGGGDVVFEFSRMVGNDVTGANGGIRGKNAAGARWKVERAEARLSEDRELRVEVEGLVLQSTGANPSTTFGATLSCLTNGEPNTPLVSVNLETARVSAGPEGDAEIREVLEGIPAPCYAPIVFVTGAAASRPWFAVSGF